MEEVNAVELLVKKTQEAEQRRILELVVSFAHPLPSAAAGYAAANLRFARR
jgi:hypothetical protein